MMIMLKCDAPGCTEEVSRVGLDKLGRLRPPVGWIGLGYVTACSVQHLGEAVQAVVPEARISIERLEAHTSEA
jgi:hypothetical protein